MSRKNKFRAFAVGSSRGVVEIELNDGGVGVRDATGAVHHYDGWATIEDIAEEIVDQKGLSTDEAQSVAAEAVRRWEEWLGDRRHGYRV